jgi:hypothetical protein
MLVLFGGLKAIIFTPFGLFGLFGTDSSFVAEGDGAE